MPFSWHPSEEAVVYVLHNLVIERGDASNSQRPRIPGWPGKFWYSSAKACCLAKSSTFGTAVAEANSEGLGGGRQRDDILSRRRKV